MRGLFLLSCLALSVGACSSELADDRQRHAIVRDSVRVEDSMLAHHLLDSLRGVRRQALKQATRVDTIPTEVPPAPVYRPRPASPQPVSPAVVRPSPAASTPPSSPSPVAPEPPQPAASLPDSQVAPSPGLPEEEPPNVPTDTVGGNIY